MKRSEKARSYGPSVERLRRVREKLNELDVGGVIIHADGWTKDEKYQLRYRGLFHCIVSILYL